MSLYVLGNFPPNSCIAEVNKFKFNKFTPGTNIKIVSEKEAKWEKDFDVQNIIIKEIKGLAMCLSRFKPADWNKFLDVVIKWWDNILIKLHNCFY